ncbi:diguanylate cyclase [Kamptonema sp. UHCC 0994]|uniref:sensor domain-containing diguanylate cyclase n=1 Tax=Kamptonema sp. UHCC 0994 TaxID=3031329 RepID=UPI0023B9C138|nr:diguanylate cyclase [Kamptonema sp. UHCC 0994]MDF0552107.1 diguanylate cyclase [Kamptonema sp. UHCC 0994]
MSEYVCPLCSYPLLSHVRLGKLYWLCRHCNQEIPYGLSNTIGKHSHVEETVKRYKLLSENTRDIVLFLQLDGRITEANKPACQAYGYEREEILSLNIQHLQVPDNLNGFAEQMAKAEKEAFIFETVHLRKNGEIFPVEVTAKSIEIGEEKIILNIIQDITERKQVEKLLAQQCDRDRLIGAMQERIQQSLSLKEILNSTVAELREFLQADRVIIHRFLADGNGSAVVEAVASDFPSMLEFIIHYPSILEKKYLQQYQNGKCFAITDIHHAGLDLRLIQLLTFFNIKARLAIPILQNTPESEFLTGNQLWGLLIVHQCSASRQWQTSEIDLLKGMATQIAIAIQQSELNQQLQIAQEKLQQLTLLDRLTLIANRQRFDEYLLSEWQRAVREKIPLSLIIWEIDFLKKYNDTYGYQAGDRCLKQIATTIRSTVNRSSALVARYSDTEFAAILPNAEAENAVLIVEEIRFRVKALEITHSNSQISKYITLSYGIASTIPDSKSSPAQMIADAELTLSQAKTARMLSSTKKNSHSLISQLPLSSQNQASNLIPTQQKTSEKNTNIELLMSYVAYYVSRGKSILSPMSGPLFFRGLVYEYWGYHRDFNEFWKQLQERRDFRELYVEGDIDCFGNFLGGNCTVIQCARCNLPIPVSEGSAYNVPNCTLCNNPLNSEKMTADTTPQNFEDRVEKTRVVAIGTPPTDSRTMKRLFSVNGFEVTFLSNIEAVHSQFLPSVVDMVLIYAEISETEGQAWAEELRCYPQLQQVPIVALSPKVKFSLPWVERNLGVEDYILAPLGGERLANHLRRIYEFQPTISATDLYWFPR